MANRQSLKELQERLAQRVAASERRHSGEVRICVEAALPWWPLWRSQGDGAARQLGRQRALDWFARLRIWDTEQNNGVLIYLLLAEQAIEIVADRGLTRMVDDAQWQAVVDRLGQRLRDLDRECLLLAERISPLEREMLSPLWQSLHLAQPPQTLV